MNQRKNKSLLVVFGKRNQRRILKRFRKKYQLKILVHNILIILIGLIHDTRYLQINKIKIKNKNKKNLLNKNLALKIFSKDKGQKMIRHHHCKVTKALKKLLSNHPLRNKKQLKNQLKSLLNS